MSYYFYARRRKGDFEMTTHVFFEIMLDDLFAGEESIDGVEIDYDASVSKFAEMASSAIRGYYGGTIDVSYETKNASMLQTRIDGDAYHEDVPLVDSIIDDVWATWNWVVTK
jgi:hypothetical protein